jgi:hypothetical protein
MKPIVLLMCILIASADLNGHVCWLVGPARGSEFQTAEEPKARKVGEYSGENNGGELAFLDNLAVMLQTEPTSRGYVMIYPGRRDPPDSGEKRVENIRKYMTETRGLDPSVLTFKIKCRVRVVTTELWQVPQGAIPPK